jgi:hypothetical protein
MPPKVLAFCMRWMVPQTKLALQLSMNFPEELRIKEYGEAVKLLDELRKMVEDGEVMSVLAVVEMADGGMGGMSTATSNVYALYGYLLSWAMIRMGFSHVEESKRSEEER